MTREELIATVEVTFPSGEMLPVIVFREWLEQVLIPQLWRDPDGGATGALPIIYGTQNPNDSTPTDPYSIGFFYQQTDDGTDGGNPIAFYQYNGIEWVLIANISGSNFVTYTAQSKTEPERKLARTNLGLDFDETNIDPLEYYLNEINS